MFFPIKACFWVLTFLEELVPEARTPRFRGEAGHQAGHQAGSARFRKVPLRFPFRFPLRFPEGPRRFRGFRKVPQGSLRFLKDFPYWEGSARFREVPRGSAKVPRVPQGSLKISL